MDDNISKLCSDGFTIGTILLNRDKLHYFGHKEVYIFALKSVVGQQTDESDPHFQKLDSIEKLPLNSYKGFDPKKRPFFTTQKLLCDIEIENNRFKCWPKEGKKGIEPQVYEIERREPEAEDEPEQENDVLNGGAIININEDNNNNCNFKLIKKDIVFDIVNQNNSFYIKAKSKNNIVTNGLIIGAIKLKNNNWYFINSEGQYCKRSDHHFEEVLLLLQSISLLSNINLIYSAMNGIQTNAYSVVSHLILQII